MRKKLLVGLATGLFLVSMSGLAQALTTTGGTDVGSLDFLRGAAKLGNSGDAEVAFIEGVLGDGWYISTKYDTTDGDGWYDVTGYTTYFAHELQTGPGYYVIKTGGNTGSPNDTFLFENRDSLDWAVIDLVGMGFTGSKIITNIGKISHITEAAPAPVPEPTTMLLFGTGLAGLAGFARRRKK